MKVVFRQTSKYTSYIKYGSVVAAVWLYSYVFSPLLGLVIFAVRRDNLSRKMAVECNSPSLTGLSSPKTLYDLSVYTVASRFIRYKKYFTYLPENILFDIYYQVNMLLYIL